jgi:Luciferase-like monooxygenase
MEFGYFTLSDNHYENNTRTSNQFIADITDEALYADEIGMHSAWIGEHHFNSLGILSCPDIVLSYIASRTRNIRLAPAVTVLPGMTRSPTLSPTRQLAWRRCPGLGTFLTVRFGRAPRSGLPVRVCHFRPAPDIEIWRSPGDHCRHDEAS